VLRLDENSARSDDCRNRLEACSAHRLARLYQIDDSIRDAQRAGSLDTAADVLDDRLQLRVLCLAIRSSRLLRLQSPEVLLSEVCEAGDYVLADEVFGLAELAFGGDLDLQAAFAEVEVEDFFYACGGCGWDHAFMLGDLVAAGYA
jgi:hypothetical protein